MRLHHHREGEGQPLVLLHGIGSRWQMWQPVLPALAAEHDVVALDLPGFGASPMPPAGTPAGVDSLCALVADFLDELGLDRPHLAGNSLGGLIALELARRGRARSVCAISPAGFFNRVEMTGARGLLWSTARVTRWLSPRANGLIARPRARVLLMNGFAAHPERIPADDAVAMTADFARAPWFDETLRAVAPWDTGAGQLPGDVPVTLLWGDHDRLLWPWQGRRAAELLPGSRLVSLAGCGHLPTFDDPRLVAEQMLAASAASVS